MTFKSSALSGAAFAALIGMATLTPAVAYTHHPSTAAERQQTDQLNAQALQNATVGTPAGSAAPTDQQAMNAAPADQGAMNTAQATPSSSDPAAAPAGQQAASASSTDPSMNTAQAAPATPDNQQMASAAPMSGTASSATMSLDSVSNSQQTLANASVESATGQAIGAVQKVTVGSDGKPQSVDIALLGAQSKVVSVAAAQLSYDQSRNVVVAQLSADQLQAMPSAPQG